MVTAASRYSQLEPDRSQFITRAERHAKVTIPALFPPNGTSKSSDLYTPYQSVGSRGVNVLAAKFLMALFPSNSPFFKLGLDDLTLQELTGKDDLRGETDATLSRIERKALMKMETSLIRPTLSECFKQLIIAGNICLHFPSPKKARAFRLSQYVVKRSPSGAVLEGIIKETISKAALPKSVLAMVEQSGGGAISQPKLPSEKQAPNSQTVDVFTYVSRNGERMEWFQEVGGVVIEGTQGSSSIEKCPYLFLRFSKIDSEDYGRAYIEDYYGDLLSLEALEEALTTGAIALSKLFYLVDPAGSTRAEDLTNAENGAFVEGRREDISVLQADKMSDFSFISRRIDAIEQRLAYAFLLNTAIQRPGERVTAEEIRYMARELEDVLGGVYSVMSQELQYPLATILLDVLARSKELPKLPPQITTSVVTGIDALGRGQEFGKLTQLFAGAANDIGPQEVQRRVNSEEYFKRRGAALGLDTSGLILTDEEIAQKQAEAAMQNATPEMIRTGGNLAAKAMEQPVGP